ncbi:hypothetical protein [Hymenobacter sp. UYP22]|uniref:hypothetical protein n=1 Tax=Hymenobacter sp. UYP22 TaxID=3156348 RepID=UPI00339657E3
MRSFTRVVFIVGLPIAGALFASCSKDAMPTVEEGLVGRWEWQQTTAEDRPALTPSNTSHQVVVEFDRRGRARFYQDGTLISAAAFSVRREMGGFGKPSKHLIIYRGYQNNQYYSVIGNRLQLQDTSGKLLAHSYTRVVPEVSANLPVHKPH